MKAGAIMERARTLLRERAVPVQEPGAGLDATEASTAWTLSYRAGRLLALPLAFLAFAAGFTLDDLHVLRLPTALAGAALAVLILAAGPVLLARGPYGRALAMDGAAANLYLERAITRARLLLGVSAALFTGWLVLLTNGLTPRW